MIVTRTVEEIRAYSDSDGVIWIAQDAQNGEEEDLIRFYPEHVDRMIAALIAAKEVAEKVLNSENADA